MKFERGLSETPLRLESLENERQNKPPSKKGPKLADLSSETAGAEARSHSGTFSSMDDGPKEKSSLNFQSSSCSSNISVCKQNFCVCQDFFPPGQMTELYSSLSSNTQYAA